MEKFYLWNGTNKTFVRNEKLKLTRTDGTIVSLPGPKAYYETEILKNFPKSNLVGVQSIYKLPNHNGLDIYNELMDLNLGFPVWAGDIEDFFWRLKNNILNKNNLPQKLYPYLSNFPTHISNISTVDLDMCGIFSRKLLRIIHNIFLTKSLCNKFILFVNVQKGRDVRGTRLFDLLETYNIYEKDLETIRYYWFPYIIISIGQKYGYFGRSTDLWEYSDKNKNNIGVNMLQYRFYFNNRISFLPPPKRRAGDYRTHLLLGKLNAD